MVSRVKQLEREVELLKQIIDLTKQLEELKARPPICVPVYPNPWYPVQPYDPWPIRYEPYYPSITTGSVTVSDNVTWFKA